MTRTQADADTLFRRLESGYAKIEQAEQERRDKTFLEDFWLSLLREYEAVVTELQQAHEPQPEPEPPATQKGMFG